MKSTSIGFLGGGRVVSILLGGLDRAGVTPRRVVVSDADDQVLARLKGRHPYIRTFLDRNAEAAAQEVVFVALHPPVVRQVLREVAEYIRADAVVISLAPGIKMDELSDLLGGFRRLARMIPNAPAIVGWGYNPISFSYAIEERERQTMRASLSALGFCPEVPEENLEACAVITAMGPTYFWPQLYELQALAETFGLGADCARDGIARMIRGTVAVMLESGLSPDEVMDLVPSKPLADVERTLRQIYREKLPGLIGKLRNA